MTSYQNYEKICPTCKLTALMRALANLPYCWETAGLVGADKVAYEIFGRQRAWKIAASLAPIMELRYRAINALLKKLGAKNILEIAAGLSLRGLEMTTIDPAIHYVESDLRPVLEEKKELIGQILPFEQELPANLCFCAADALDRWQLNEVSRNFTKGPIVIVSEGLLLYLSREEKEGLAANIRYLLEKFGGVWITTDVSLKKRFGFFDQAEEIKEGLGKIAQSTGREFADNAFVDEMEANQFFFNLGFQAKYLDQISLIGSLNELRSLKMNLSVSCMNVLPRLLESAKIWVLKCQ